MASWEEMAEQVLVLGRPGDVQSAADGWDQLLKACDEVKTSLEKNVDDLHQGWKGPAYEAFKTHIKAIAKQLDTMNSDARADDGIVTALSNAAHKLEQAQQDMPVPAVCTGDIIAARNANVSIPVGFFQAKVSSSFMSSFANWTPAQWEYQVMDWFNDKTDEARGVYDRVDGQYQDQAYRTPGNSSDPNKFDNRNPLTTNTTSGGGGGLPGAGKLPGGGGLPKGGSLGGSPPGVGGLPGTGSGDLPGVGSGAGGDGLGGFDPATGSGLAGAGGGLSGAGLGGLGGGLGGAGGGLGASGLGGAGGGLPGGGAVGKGVMPSLGGMMGAGGGMGGAGGRSGRGAGGGRSGRGGMAGGGHGGHGAGEDDRTTWLQEDDDPWGTDNGTPSSVLK